MKLKIFTLPFSGGAGGFDDGPIRDFIADREVIEWTEHFFVHDKTPYLAVLLSYRDIARDERRKMELRRDPRLELDEAERKAYDALRSWRAAKARQEGIPPYLIATNKQLAKMVKLKAAAKADLAKVEGVGEAKIKQHGEEILGILAGHLQPAPQERPEAEKEPSS